MKKLCPFCEELYNPINSIWDKKRKELPLDRILYKDDDWCVFPPLGSFTKGGLLIVSLEHYRCCADIPIDMFTSLKNVVNKVQNILKNVYGKNVIFFEHGPSSCSSKGTCCVDHAHINVFPVDFTIWGQLPSFEQKIEIVDFKMIKSLFKEEYLWIFDSFNNYAYPTTGIPSKFIRTLITKNMGFSERWNWQNYLGLDEIKETIQDLKKKF